MRTLGLQGLSGAWADQECSLEEVMGGGVAGDGVQGRGCRGGVLQLEEGDGYRREAGQVQACWEKSIKGELDLKGRKQ